MLPQMNVRKINEILVLAQPGFVQRVAGRDMAPEERDVKRAELIRHHVSS